MAAPAAARSLRDPVALAMVAAGGRGLLERVRTLSWSGTSRARIGGLWVDLLIEMRIEPFARARVDSWLASEGRSAMQTVMIERDSAFVVHNGAQTPLPGANALFEAQKLAVFGYLLLAQAQIGANGPERLEARRDGFPPIVLTLARDGRIAAADYALLRGAATVRQHFRFVGTVSAEGVHFPRVTTITQDGRAQQQMTITDFSVELSPL